MHNLQNSGPGKNTKFYDDSQYFGTEKPMKDPDRTGDFFFTGYILNNTRPRPPPSPGGGEYCRRMSFKRKNAKRNM